MNNSGYQVYFDRCGYMYILRRNGQRFDLTHRTGLQSSAYYHGAILNFDGVFDQYYHPKVFTASTNWAEDICSAIMGDIGSGACWYNSVCRFNDDSRPICECPQGFSLLDSDDKYGSCKPSFVQSCDVNEFSSSAAENRYEFLQINDTD